MATVRSRRLRQREAVDILGPAILYEDAKTGCSFTETARRLGMQLGTLRDYMEKNPALQEAWDRGRGDGARELRKLQWRHARRKGAGAVSMTIHMSKHLLGEHERSLQEHHVKPSDEFTEILKLIDGTTRGLPDPSKIPDREMIDVTPNDEPVDASTVEDRGGESSGNLDDESRPHFDLPDPSRVPERS